MTDHKNIIPDYDLLAKYFAGEASVTQIKDIENWVAEDAANKKSFDRMHFLWMQSAKNELVKQVNVTDAWTKMQFRMNAAKQAPKPEAAPEKKEVNIYKRTTYRLLQFAAVIIIALGINMVIRMISDVEYVSKEAQSASLELKLPDNSEIKLSKQSKISYPEEFKGKERRVKLEGEAFFDVAHNKEKPFIIEAQFAQIKVLGTSFKIEAFDSTNVVEVTVITGTVELSSKDNSGEKILLQKGEKGKIEKDTGRPIKEISVVENEQESKKFIFKEAELYVIADFLEKAYGVEIEFANEDIKHCNWDITIQETSIDFIMDLIEASFPITIEQTENKYTIDGTACQ